MPDPLRLLCVLAHPDDESLGLGGTLAKYSAEGVETYLVTATRGERGRFGDAAERPAPEVVGKVREKELLAAARELGLKDVAFLDYVDKDLDRAPPDEAVAKIVSHVRRVRPQVVITFGPEGAYGHPDHIAISQLTVTALVAAADCDYGNGAGGGPHRVSKMYYMAWTKEKWAAYQAAFRTVKTEVDGQVRQAAPWESWAVTTVIDTRAHWPAAWRAVLCHKTQMALFGQLEHLSEEHHGFLWGTQEFYRVYSSVNGGRARESDLFEGLK